MECDRKLRCSNEFVTIKGVQFKGLKCILEDFLIGNLQVTFLSVLQSPLLSPCQLLKEWLLFPDFWMCLIWVPAPISQLLLEGRFEVWSIFSASLVEPTKASKKTRRSAKAYRVRRSPQNHACLFRNSKLGNWSLVILGSKVVCLSGESRAAPWIFFAWVGLAACLSRVSGPISAASRSLSLKNPRHGITLAVEPSPHLSQILQLLLSLPEGWMFIGRNKMKKNRKKNAVMLFCSRTSNVLDIQNHQWIGMPSFKWRLTVC